MKSPVTRFVLHRPSSSDARLSRRGADGRPIVKRRRRRLLTRILRPLLVVVLVVGAPVGATTWALTTPRLALEEVRIDIDPEGRVASDWVRSQVMPLRGHHLLRLPLGELETALLSHRWVDAVSLRKELPRRLSVRVIERRPAALLYEDELVYLDTRGQRIAPFDPSTGEVDLPIVRRRDRDDESALTVALALIDELERVAPHWAAGLSEIDVLGASDARVVTRALPYPVLLRAGTLDTRLHRLRPVLDQIDTRYGVVRELDLRFSGRIVVRPVEVESPASIGGSEPPTDDAAAS
ncbi:MAG: FtsQ-type POTRA domain-containing protein [Acidobacteriota bacterium]